MFIKCGNRFSAFGEFQESLIDLQFDCSTFAGWCHAKCLENCVCRAIEHIKAYEGGGD